MNYNLKISVFKEPQTGGLAVCRNLGLREKLLARLFGSKSRVMLLIPGNSVKTLTIQEVADGEDG